ncbi:MAG: site-2 protease family protein, partial [Candidatus Thorarchaeota archaeon]|nr:site-2 protease family protein [Candidatus Thorarchaeota archaeon]
LVLSPTTYALPVGPFMPVPFFFQLAITSLGYLGISKPGNIIILHPVAFAGMIGMIVTMLNLLPTGMLDGGHVARSISGDKIRSILTFGSLIFLIWNGYYPMAIFALFLSLFRHPGPLDDVSSLSKARKAIIPILLVVFILCGMMIAEPVHQIKIDSNMHEVTFRIYYADSIYEEANTTWTALLAEGTYNVSFPLSYTINGVGYTFKKWEDFESTNPNRTIVLNQEISIKAIYLNSSIVM